MLGNRRFSYTMANRNKLIELFISNLANAVVHDILEKAVAAEEIADKYRKEIVNSFQLAKKYREKINPRMSMPDKDISYIKHKIKNKVTTELRNRIERGYKGINLDLIDEIIERMFGEMRIKN
jgi:uncharacterized protein with HEPN domain